MMIFISFLIEFIPYRRFYSVYVLYVVDECCCLLCFLCSVIASACHRLLGSVAQFYERLQQSKCVLFLIDRRGD